MKRFFTYIVIAVVAFSTLTLGGCKKQGEKRERPDPIEIVSLDKVGGSLSEGWNVTVTLANNTGFNIRITSAAMFLRQNNKKIGHLALSEEIALPRRSQTQVTVPVNVAFPRPLEAMSILNKVRKGDYSGLTIDYSVKVSTRLIKEHTVTGESTPLKDIIDALYK